MYDLAAPQRLSYTEEAGEWAAATPSFLTEGDSAFFIAHSGPMPPSSGPPEVPESGKLFVDRLQGIHHFFQRLIGPIMTISDETIETIGVYLHKGSLLTCSNGLHEEETGYASHAWVFSDSAGHILWCRFGPIDGHPDMLSSYRSELGGVTTLLFLLWHIVQHLDITTGTVTLFCDNTSALGNVFDPYPKRGI